MRKGRSRTCIHQIHLKMQGPIDREPLLDSGVCCCLIQILNSFPNPDKDDQVQVSTKSREIISTKASLDDNIVQGRRLEAGLLHAPKCCDFVLTHVTPQRAFFSSLFSFIMIQLEGSKVHIMKGLVPLHTIQLHRHAMQILGLLVINGRRDTAKYVPKHHLKKSGLKCSLISDKLAIDTCSLVDLPDDLLRLIISRVIVSELANLAVVCKTLRSLTDPIHSYSSSLPFFFYRLPFDPSGQCQLFSPWSRKTYEVHIPQLSGAQIHYSKDSWLVAVRGHNIFMLNIFTQSQIDLPENYLISSLQSICFSASPGSSSTWKVVALHQFDDHLSILTWQSGQRHWNRDVNVFQSGFILSHCSPVFLDGMFYCLGTGGRLATFNLESGAWTVLPSPEPLFLDEPHVYSFLSEQKGQLYAAFTFSRHQDLKVFKLDELKRSWVKLESIDQNMIFINLRCTLMLETSNRAIGNRVYYSMLHSSFSPTRIAATMTCMKDHIFFKLLQPSDTKSMQEADCVSYSFVDRGFLPSGNWESWRHFPDSVWILPPSSLL